MDVDLPLGESGVSKLVGLGELDEATASQKGAPKGSLVHGPQVVVEVEIVKPVDSLHDNRTDAWWLIVMNFRDYSV